MYKHFLLRIPSFEPHYEGVQGNIPMEVRFHRPSDHHSGVQVYDNGKVEPALIRANIGYIGNPGFVRLGNGKLPVQVIVSHD